MATAVLAGSGTLETWVEGRKPAIDRIDQVLTDLRAAPSVDLSMLAVANRRFGELAGV